MSQMQWDPVQYARFADERSRPFFDLVAAIGATKPLQVVDLGCGSGELTVTLAERWPDARVIGIDSSADMIAAAPRTDRVAFDVGLVEDFAAAGVDVIVSNAVLQWVPGHQQVLRRWVGELPPGGWIAFQVPSNFSSPSHRIMRELAASPRWAAQLGDTLRHDDAVATPERYLDLLTQAGVSASVWQTTYFHVLVGADPVLEWVRGTGLRPVLEALTDDDAAEFSAEYARLLREAYPATDYGTVFPFQRTFAVGQVRPGG